MEKFWEGIIKFELVLATELGVKEAVLLPSSNQKLIEALSTRKRMSNPNPKV